MSDDPLAAARERGRRFQADVLASDEVVPLSRFADVLGISQAEVLDLADRGKVLKLVDDSGQTGFPIWQVLGSGKLLPGIETLHGLMIGGPWTIFWFLTVRDPSLGCLPLEALLAGQVERVISAARFYEGLE